MPELPEVETVRRGLARLVPAGTRIARVELRRADLRAPIPAALPRRLRGARVDAIRRLGKYLLWETERGVLVNHLGMTGTWRVAAPGEERLHDHVYVHLEGGPRLAFRDPRRFGYLGLARTGREREHPALASLGPDPLDPSAFSPAYLGRALAGRRAPIKALLLDQRLAAGIGNIYATEALFRAGIRPATPAGRLRPPRLERLVGEVRAVLEEAIAAGGSTLRDYRQAGGEIGDFQSRFLVYGRVGELCPRCEGEIRGLQLGGRGTAWCPRCQR